MGEGGECGMGVIRDGSAKLDVVRKRYRDEICQGDLRGSEKSLAVTDVDDDDLDLRDVILSGIVDMVLKMRIIGGGDKPVIDLGNGVEIMIEKQDSRQPWRERLVSIQGAVFDVVDANPTLNAEVVSMAILEADGWSWTRATFRSPLWMNDNEEVPHSVVLNEFKGMKWIAKFSSVTR